MSRSNLFSARTMILVVSATALTACPSNSDDANAADAGSDVGRDAAGDTGAMACSEEVFARLAMQSRQQVCTVAETACVAAAGSACLTGGCRVCYEQNWGACMQTHPQSPCRHEVACAYSCIFDTCGQPTQSCAQSATATGGPCAQVWDSMYSCIERENTASPTDFGSFCAGEAVRNCLFESDSGSDAGVADVGTDAGGTDVGTDVGTDAGADR